MSGDVILDIKDLRVHFDTLYGPIEALHDIDLQVMRGEIRGVVGESGCGKSVTSLTAIGLATCKVDDGQILYDGYDTVYRIKDWEKNLIRISTAISYIGALIIVFNILRIIFDTSAVYDIIAGIGIMLLGSLVGLIGRFSSYKHEKELRRIRGNEISMIFQEPMTALNPLYTVEKQISEVMKEHGRLVEREAPTPSRILRAVLKPATQLADSITKNPLATLTPIGVLIMYFTVTSLGYSGLFEKLSWYFIPVIVSAFTASAIYEKEKVNWLISLTKSIPYLIISILYFIYSSIYKYTLGLLNINNPLTSIEHDVEEINNISLEGLSSLPLAFAFALTLFMMFWMPASAVMVILVTIAVFMIPGIMISDFLKLDPSHSRQVVQILEEVQIPNPETVSRMYPHELSGGMRQRVMIAMMMSCEPNLLIADEPTTALDVTIQAQILKLMRDMRDQKGTSIMLITHDLGVIAEMCDTVSVMYAGTIVESGSLKDVLERPRMPYSIGLLHSIPRIITEAEGGRKESLPIIPGQVPDPNEHFDGCRFHPRCPFADEICVSTKPEMIEVNPSHFAACHHVEKTTNVSHVESAFENLVARMTEGI